MNQSNSDHSNEKKSTFTTKLHPWDDQKYFDPNSENSKKLLASKIKIFEILDEEEQDRLWKHIESSFAYYEACFDNRLLNNHKNDSFYHGEEHQLDELKILKCI